MTSHPLYRGRVERPAQPRLTGPLSPTPACLSAAPNRQPLIPVMRSAVIAMTAVRRVTCHQPGKIIGHADLFSPTDVMVITSPPPAAQPIIIYDALGL